MNEQNLTPSIKGDRFIVGVRVDTNGHLKAYVDDMVDPVIFWYQGRWVWRNEENKWCNVNSFEAGLVEFIKYWSERLTDMENIEETTDPVTTLEVSVLPPRESSRTI
jgi:hypothetical protein